MSRRALQPKGPEDDKPLPFPGLPDDDRAGLPPGYDSPGKPQQGCLDPLLPGAEACWVTSSKLQALSFSHQA